MTVCFVHVLKFRIYLIPCISKVSFVEWVARVMVKKARKMMHSKLLKGLSGLLLYESFEREPG